MQDIRTLFADYASYHQTPGNKLFHRLGIPLIMLSLIGMLARVQLWHAGSSWSLWPGIRVQPVDGAMVLIAIAQVYYLIIEWRLAAMMLVVSSLFYAIAVAIPFWLNLLLFTLGWIFQFIGHSVYEHRQPAFFRNFVHLLIGPLWILNDAIPVVKSSTLNVISNG